MPERSRQLAAIMFTDIVGYTALMGEDEERAFELLKKNRNVQRPIIERFNGRWLKEIGDGVLASFSTVSDAVYCAGAIQQACENEPDLNLRIGIHQGEVVFEGADVVNIASRLEPLAPIGGIMVSESVNRDLGNKKGIETIFVGEETLKNVKEPLKIYQVKVAVADIPKPDPTAAVATPDKIGTPKSKPSYQRTILGTAVIILSFLAAYFIYNYNSGSETAIESTPQAQIMDKSIAVLPFVNMSNDPDQEALCDGLTEEIIHHLSRIKSFDKVISRNSVMSLKSSDKTLPEIAALLKVNIVLEGSFQQSGDQIKITAQLIDAANDNHLWPEIYERPFGDIFEIQSEIAKNIAAKFDVDITEEEAARLDKKPTESTEAYILLKKGLYKIRNFTDLQGAIDLFKKAIEKDPSLAEGYAALADAYLTADIFFIGDKSIQVEDPLPLVQEALRLDPELSEGYVVLGLIHHWKEWNFSEAEAAYKKALELDPKNSFSNWCYADFLVKMGRAAEALPYIEKAVELNPTMPINLTELSKFYFYAGNKEKANETMQEYKSLFPNSSFAGPLGLNYLYLNSLEKAIENLEKDKEIPLYSSFLAIAYTKNGQNQKAQPLVDRLKLISEKKAATSPEYSVGLYYSGIGQKEEALYWLERAYKSHDSELYWLKTEPMFKSLYGDPRYEDLLRRIGFPE